MADQALDAKHEKRLLAAKRKRQRDIIKLTAIYEACTCCWPLDSYRNLHGHGDKCPAIKIWESHREADQIAREDLE